MFLMWKKKYETIFYTNEIIEKCFFKKDSKFFAEQSQSHVEI